MDTNDNDNGLELAFVQMGRHGWWPAVVGDNWDQFFNAAKDKNDRAKIAISILGQVAGGQVAGGHDFKAALLFDKDLDYKSRMVMIKEEEV
jgi:hypothetical protein